MAVRNPTIELRWNPSGNWVILKISFECPRKWVSNFTKLHLTHEIFRILPVFSQLLWNLAFIFSGSRKKRSFVLLQMTNYMFIPWKMEKGMQYTLHYSATWFLFTENWSYSISLWIRLKSFSILLKCCSKIFVAEYCLVILVLLSLSAVESRCIRRD